MAHNDGDSLATGRIRVDNLSRSGVHDGNPPGFR